MREGEGEYGVRGVPTANCQPRGAPCHYFLIKSYLAPRQQWLARAPALILMRMSVVCAKDGEGLENACEAQQ